KRGGAGSCHPRNKKPRGMHHGGSVDRLWASRAWAAVAGGDGGRLGCGVITSGESEVCAMRHVVLFGALLIAQCDSVARDKSAEPKLQKDLRLSRETPEGTLRVFTLGVLISNEQLIRQTVGDIPEEELKYLRTETAQNRPSDKELKERCASMKVRVLQ